MTPSSPTLVASHISIATSLTKIEPDHIELDLTQPLEERGCFPALDVTPFNKRIIVYKEGRLSVYENKISWFVRTFCCCCVSCHTVKFSHAESIMRYEQYLLQQEYSAVAVNLIPFLKGYPLRRMKQQNLPLTVESVKQINLAMVDWSRHHDRDFRTLFFRLKLFLLAQTPIERREIPIPPEKITFQVNDGESITPYDQNKLDASLKVAFKNAPLGEPQMKLLIKEIEKILKNLGEKLITTHEIMSATAEAMQRLRILPIRPTYADALECNVPSPTIGESLIKCIKKVTFMFRLRPESLFILHKAYMVTITPKEKRKGQHVIFTIPPPTLVVD